MCPCLPLGYSRRPTCPQPYLSDAYRQLQHAANGYNDVHQGLLQLQRRHRWERLETYVQSHTATNIAPPFFQNGAKSGFGMCFAPSPFGAGGNSRLESSNKRFNHVVFILQVLQIPQVLLRKQHGRPEGTPLEAQQCNLSDYIIVIEGYLLNRQVCSSTQKPVNFYGWRNKSNFQTPNIREQGDFYVRRPSDFHDHILTETCYQ